ncbi:hypothetical protein PN462_20290 [Spirulina sp. CS-785/01]|uniref:hypothetical protein n=1 Tax=Spirulina sp. CS-785/01 TaxID=3021716 RepID=UPI0023312F53|nr:hypothetical protein [Spirulina sp. CS-785/01]MDB9315465.1 hypothetical protein [Spirulina sp. CS-785/01]
MTEEFPGKLPRRGQFFGCHRLTEAQAFSRSLAAGEMLNAQVYQPVLTGFSD